MNIVMIIKRIIMMCDKLKYTIKGNEIGPEVEIGNNVHLRQCKIGGYCYIGRGNGFNHTTIGPYCSIASGVQIGGMEHSLWWKSTNTHLSNECVFGKKTIIGPDVWIAASSIIKQGVTIGQGAVVGANSFVNKDVPPYAVVVGSPAKIIKYRFSDDVIAKLMESHYWELPPKEAKKILATIDIESI